ncbi:Plug domain-containing protein [Sphingobium aromaticiconvertens]|uniref:Plug domain-containing protein n=1 Tax=Sphingobium aromaticiconvertens TaxID=365341 RepID=UPI003017F3A4
MTARRREERLQDVPLSVSAVSSAALQRANISNVAQLSRVVPSLVSVPGQGGGRSLPTFSIRGLSQQELTILADQSVSTYMGDMVLARTQGVNGAIFDIGSVEVSVVRTFGTRRVVN